MSLNLYNNGQGLPYPFNGSGLPYSLTTLSGDTGIFGRDSALYFPLDADRMLLAYGWNSIEFAGTNNVTNEAYTTTDGITFTPIDDAPDNGDHAFGFLPGDGYAWFVGNMNTGNIFVHKLNLTTLAWTRVSNNITISYAQWGFYHGGYMYIAVVNGVTTELHRSNNGTSFSYFSTFPVRCENACAYVDGTTIRVGPGAVDTAGTTSAITSQVYESTDASAWSGVSTIPTSAMGSWGSIIRHGTKEIIFSGYNSSNSAYQGEMWSREYNVDEWFFIGFQNWLGGKHALAAATFKSKVFVGFGSTLADNSSYSITIN